MSESNPLPLAPYSAVLVQSYGGPTGPETVLPFMRNATRGRGIPDERLLEVSEHYQMFGGVSPINEANERLVTAISDELAARGIEVPVAIGNRNWKPFVDDVVRELSDAGHQRVLGVATSAYGSYSGCRQYHEDAEQAMAALREARPDATMQIDQLAPFSTQDGFVQANADALLAALSDLPADADLPRVLFTTHSIPTAMNDASGGSRGTYVDQHLQVCERVAQIVHERIGRPIEWELVYCSRSGPPHVPWLEPDINDRLEELADQGVSRVVSAPIGFIADHMEVVYDLDTEAAATAKELDIDYRRAGTVGVDPAFVSSLVDAIVEHAQAVAAGRAPKNRFDCGKEFCCLQRPAGSPGGPPHHS